jgi:predicted GTPase
MTPSDHVAAVVTKALEEAMRDRGRLNILIAGRTGVGKSTLVNAVFQGRLAEAGQGRPVTTTTREITKDGLPLAIWDT